MNKLKSACWVRTVRLQIRVGKTFKNPRGHWLFLTHKSPPGEIKISKTAVTINVLTPQQQFEWVTVYRGHTAVGSQMEKKKKRLRLSERHALILLKLSHLSELKFPINQMVRIHFFGEERWPVTRKTLKHGVWVEVVSVVRLHINDEILLWWLARQQDIDLHASTEYTHCVCVYQICTAFWSSTQKSTNHIARSIWTVVVTILLQF